MIRAENFLRLRRRSGWEASDAGILLWRGSLGPLFLFFALPFALVFGVFYVLPLRVLPWFVLGLWWLNPLFDRLALHVISVRFFEPGASLARLARGLGASLGAALAGDLLWRRFSLWRSGRMPVRVLERLKGRAARKRIAMLESGGLGFSVMLTILGAGLNCMLFIGESVFSILMLGLLNVYIAEPSLTLVLVRLAGMFYGINFMVVESLYVCMGFGVYINSRLETEGWDLQLDFQRFAGEHSRKSQALPGLVLILGLLVLGPRTLYGEEGAVPPPPLVEQDAALEALDEVFASPDFGTQKDGWRLRPKKKGEARAGQSIPVPGFEDIKTFFGRLLRILVFAGIAGLMGLGLYRYLKAGPFLSGSKKWKTSALYGDKNKESLEALLEEARELHRRGLVREAWACCFAAILAAFSQRDRVSFPRDATEYGCLRTLRARGSSGAEAFSGFLGLWMGLAYGGRDPAPGRFEEALDFCASINACPPEGAAPSSRGQVYG